MDRVRIYQLNVGHRISVNNQIQTRDPLPYIMGLREPYISQSSRSIPSIPSAWDVIHVADQPRITKIIPNTDLKFVTLCFKRDIIIVMLYCASKLAIVNVHASPTQDIEPKLHQLQTHLEKLKEVDAIIIGDFNAKSRLG